MCQPPRDFGGILDTGYGPVKIGDTAVHRSKLLNDPALPFGCTAADADDNCGAWAQTKECEKNMLYMEQVCPCSCTLRAQATPPPAAAPAGLSSSIEPAAPAPPSLPMHEYNVAPAPKEDFSKNLVVALPP